MKTLFLLLAMVLFAGTVVVAQCDGKPGPDGLTWNFDEGEKEGFNLLRFVGGLFTPDLIKETKLIRGYVRDPRFAVLVVLDRPQKEHWGGLVAGPVFQEIAQYLVTALGVPPDNVNGQ